MIIFQKALPRNKRKTKTHKIHASTKHMTNFYFSTKSLPEEYYKTS
ncbi:hypothetical protein AAJ76_263000252 [Vairimorpha ceranae]|uniref:Uncharacterized protein n=1 Tax=Vairimorpha ceranae TaxID=40302 RepID=A0A0F9W9T4_9MICR|nr:hypothetical protein AAJ76_263000252 [Vairimorpha ceranae]KKO73740.1 hypothetical protein AAJ76_263000252 [Vairimorpha ceranae]